MTVLSSDNIMVLNLLAITSCFIGIIICFYLKRFLQQRKEFLSNLKKRINDGEEYNKEFAQALMNQVEKTKKDFSDSVSSMITENNAKIRIDLINTFVESENIQTERLLSEILNNEKKQKDKFSEVMRVNERILSMAEPISSLLGKTDALEKSVMIQIADVEKNLRNDFSKGQLKIVTEIKRGNKKRPNYKNKPDVKVSRLMSQIVIEKRPITIVVAGMRHSASTAIFNFFKYLLDSYEVNYESGYSEHPEFKNLSIKSNTARIIKVHELRDDVVMSADIIISMRRNLLDTVASAVRRDFPMLEQLGGCVNYAKYNRGIHEHWCGLSDYEIVYEELMQDTVGTMGFICGELGFIDADIEGLCNKMANIPTDNYEDTLLSKDHITDPDRDMNYSEYIAESQISAIERESGAWLERYNYLVDDKQQ